MKILDPQGSFLQWWNKILTLSCVIAVSIIDPLFFYIPVIDGQRKCLDLDKTLETTACVLRTFIDAFYILHIIFQFRTGFIAPSSRVFGRGELVKDPWTIAKRYFSSYFIVDILAILPLPQVIGACWFLISVERQDRCWNDECKRHKCDSKYLYCGEVRPPSADYSFLNSSSDLLIECSSLGQDLKTSTFVGEIVFAVFISIAGLVLFALLIGNMQKYLQYIMPSTTVRVDEMVANRQDTEQWMAHRMLPGDLRERIRRYEQYKWQETRGVEEETIIRNLPKDLRRDIKRHLCLRLLRRVPMFEQMDELLMDALCDQLKLTLFTESSYIVREGDLVDEMLFVMKGKLVSTTTNGGRTGFYNASYLVAGDFCGEELLTWALDTKSSSNLPISTRTVQARTEVEAFSLMANDLKFIASQFHSVQWRTWAACFIQAAWRRHCKQKLAKSLREAEDRLQDALATEAGTSTSLGATIYASRFAANLLQPLRLNNRVAHVALYSLQGALNCFSVCFDRRYVCSSFLVDLGFCHRFPLFSSSICNETKSTVMILRRIAVKFPHSRRLFSSHSSHDFTSTIAEFNKEMESVFGEAPLNGFAGSVSNDSMAQESQHTSQKIGESTPSLTHIGRTGEAQMVDVSPKESSKRIAIASGKVILGKEVFDLVLANQLAKGDVLSVAKIAGISGAKHTSTLIPLCHNITLSHVRVDLTVNPEDFSVDIEGEAVSTGKTGVEMEALTAVTVAGLTVYDMCKAASKDIQIKNVRLECKTGGKSGDWSREK
ncbi:hypothetical protein Q3G72_001484 [Acer saccharum]|nr:hypothetical protein Q3G72_001484 [Acer saccharum]